MTLSHLLQVLTAATFLTGPAGTHAAAPLSASQHPKPLPFKDSDMSGMNNPYLTACLYGFARGEFSKGEQFCNLAILVNPKDADALELRGYGFLMQHRFEKAEQDLRAALAIIPDRSELLAGYGQSLTGQGRYDEAVVQFEKAVARMPDYPAYHNGLCWARAGTGKNLDVALGDCDTALRLAPGSAGPLNSHGLVNLRLERFSAAIEDYTASLAASAAQPSARFGRGLAHLALGDTAAGSTDIRAARAGDSDIDTLFIDMHILPRDCGAKPDPKCPASFPPPGKSDGRIAKK